MPLQIATISCHRHPSMLCVLSVAIWLSNDSDELKYINIILSDYNIYKSAKCLTNHRKQLPDIPWNSIFLTFS